MSEYKYSFKSLEIRSCSDCPCCCVCTSVYCEEQMRRIEGRFMEEIPDWCRLEKEEVKEA
jgi:hypothetical protein